MSADFEEKTVQIEFELDNSVTSSPNDDRGVSCDIQSVQRHVEQQTGFATVIKGVGQLSSAVAELRPPSNLVGSNNDHNWRQRAFGVVRVSQLPGNNCFFDGLLDGLGGEGGGATAVEQLPGQGHVFSLNVHEFGDLSGDSYDNIGPAHVNIVEQQISPPHGRHLSIRRIIPNCHVPSLIGRSVALSLLNSRDSSSSPERQAVSAGVIARASTIEANRKQVCSCSGKTLWEERQDKRTKEDANE